ncbi:MAG: SpoIID/LytB domain-containing protein [Anaerotignum sp.]|nr:SpoIID/LytB domain-containing protein [Anaerotignum sp.]
MKMKKQIASLLACGMLITMVPAEAMAYETPETVRVGLESVCKGVTSATVEAMKLYVGMEDDGDFEEGGMMTSGGTFTVKPATGDFVMIESEMDQDEAVDLAKALTKQGFDAYAGFLMDEEWTVYVKDASRSEVETASRENASKKSGFEGYSVSGGEVKVLLKEDAVMMGGNVDDTFKLNGKSYRGMLTFSVTGSTMTAVNVIDLDEYLYGVVPAEMPRSYETEALKAQAVAARTYAMTKLGAHTGSGYQLCDGTNCQVYKGYSNEAATTTAAVDATSGEVACYNGSPIEAVFCTSSGGYTENSENVWWAVVPYLRAVPEIAEYNNNAWTKELTLDELTKLLETKGENIGSAKDIVITKLSTGGRVQEMQIVGTKGTKTLTKENVRTYFSAACGSLSSKMFTINGKGGEIGQYGAETVMKAETPAKGGGLLAAAASKGIIAKTDGKLSHLNGKNISVDVEVSSSVTKKTVAVDNSDYEVYSVNISTVKNDKFVFEGVGAGHGVGMSQNGAQAMAQMGYDYEEILKHYYTGITIED